MKTRTITLWENQWNNYDERPNALVAYAEWLAVKLSEIPEEYRATASVEIEAEASYEDSAELKYRITYKRPETDAERMARQADESHAAENQRAFELEQLKLLRAKYPDSP